MKQENILLKSLLLLLCFPITCVFAQSASPVKSNAVKDQGDNIAKQEKPVDAFIRHVHESNTQFVEINNIWQPDNNFDQTDLLKNVDKVQPLTIDYSAVASLIQKNTIAMNLVVPGINGGTYTIDLAQYNPLAGDFKVHEKAGETETNFSYTQGKYYSGIVHGIPGSVAAFSFFKNEVWGIFSIPGVGNMVLVPNSMVGSGHDYNQNYILYNDVDLKIQNRSSCGTDKLNTDYLAFDNPANKTTTIANNNVYFYGCREVRVMEIADYAMYLTHGSNTVNTTNFMTSMFNNQATIYRNEGIIIILKYLQVNTATDVFQMITSASSNRFLAKLGWYVQNTYSTTQGCDLAMLASTALNSGYGALGGVAWLQSTCSNYRTSDSGGSYGYANMDNSGSVASFPTYSWDVEVMSHEMGHIVGSPHTHRCCWNPPGTGTTAIDGCYTLEGSCANPGLPAGGGTIMSYCHLTSVGINFTNGFGQQPGDTVRYYLSHRPTTCEAEYNPSIPLQTTNRTVLANRECTDMTSGITYYWKDNNTADQSDDTLVLMVKKNGNAIGDLNTLGFSVTANTVVRWGAGRGDTLVFPPGTSASILAQNYGMRRYWKIVPTTNPTTAVEVMFPWTTTDTLDVHGSVIGAAPLTNYLLYKANYPIDPNPINGFPGAAASDFQIYTYGATASTTVWSNTTVGTTQLAHMMMTNLNGGGTGFYTYCNGLPAPVLGTMPPAPCPGATATYSVTADPSAVSYTWTVLGTGWSGTSTTNVITLTAGTGVATIQVAANAACGAGYVTSFNITPAPLPSLSVAATTGLCTTDATVGLASSITAGSPVTTYAWTVAGTGWSASGPTNTANLTLIAGVGTATVTVKGTNVCGVGPITTYYVALTNLPPVAPTTITPPALACPSSTGIFTTPAIPGATAYTWTIAGAGWSAVSPSSSTSINVNIGTGIGTLTVHASNSCGTSADYSRNVTPSTGPGPATSIDGPSTPCSGTSITLTTPAVATASSYNWLVTGTGWSGSSSTNSIVLTVGTGIATITVNPVNACGAGGSVSKTITPAPAPVSSFAVSSHVVPVNTDIVAYFTGSAPAGSTYTWSFPGGIASPGTGSGAQTVHWTTPGQYLIFLTVSNAGGCSSYFADTINVTAAAGLQNLTVEKISANIVPNPNNGTFEIIFNDAQNAAVTVKLFDMQGRVVYQNEYANALNKRVQVETTNLSAGAYTVTIFVNDASVSKKITIFK